MNPKEPIGREKVFEEAYFKKGTIYICSLSLYLLVKVLLNGKSLISQLWTLSNTI